MTSAVKYMLSKPEHKYQTHIAHDVGFIGTYTC